VTSVTDAGKERQGPKQALALAHNAAKVVVARGKKVVTFDMKNARPDDETLLANMLGPTGNLRAPTMRLGETLIVGFSEGALQSLLG
jgi:hypothetical protein